MKTFIIFLLLVGFAYADNEIYDMQQNYLNQGNISHDEYTLNERMIREHYELKRKTEIDLLKRDRRILDLERRVDALETDRELRYTLDAD